jgi:hypothetical protein
MGYLERQVPKVRKWPELPTRRRSDFVRKREANGRALDVVARTEFGPRQKVRVGGLHGGIWG